MGFEVPVACVGILPLVLDNRVTLDQCYFISPVRRELTWALLGE